MEKIDTAAKVIQVSIQKNYIKVQYLYDIKKVVRPGHKSLDLSNLIFSCQTFKKAHNTAIENHHIPNKTF